MAIALTVKSTDGFNPNAAFPRSTASFTPSDNSLLIVAMHSIATTGASFPVFSVSGGSLTWTKLITERFGGDFDSFVEIWTAPVTTGASMSVSVALSSGITVTDGTNFSITVTEVTGHDVVGGWLGLTAVHSGAQTDTHSGEEVISLGGTTGVGSAVFSAVSADGDYGDGAITTTSGWTSIYNYQGGSSGWFKSNDQYKIGAQTDAYFGSWTANFGHTSYAFEIKAASGTVLWLYDYEIDFGLNAFSLADKIVVCSQRPTTYTEANATYKLGEKNFGTGNVVASGPVDASPTGRAITTAAVSGGTISSNGTPSHWAIIDTANSRLLAAGSMTGSEAITTADSWTLEAMTINVP